MRLLLLNTDLELGGTPTVVRELATRLSPHVEQLDVACLKPTGPVGRQLVERGIAVTSLEATSLTQLSQATARLVGLVRERQIDTVLSFLIHANFVAARASRHLGGVRWFQSIQTTQTRPRWHWWLQRRIHSAAERLLVPSESVATRAVERSRIPYEKLTVIPNGIDLDGFATLERNRCHWPCIGFVGRLDPVKRIGDLLSAMRRLPAEVMLDVFGDGSERRAIEHTIASTPELAGRVTLHGAIPDPREAYTSLDLLVLPPEAEGFGLVLIEAMAAGVPVVATDVDGIRDVVQHEQTGLLVPVGSPRRLAAAIERVLNDAELRSRLVANARLHVQRHFQWSHVVQQYLTVLRRPVPEQRQDG